MNVTTATTPKDAFSSTEKLPPIKVIDLNAQYRRISKILQKDFADTFMRTDFIGGQFVTSLEESLAERMGVRYCVSCASGTDALILALRAIGIKRDDIVLCPSYTFAATAEAIVAVGGIPEFIDIDNQTLNISTQAVKHRLSSNLQSPKGILAVDIFGQPAEYATLRAIADAYGIWLIADAAQSIGSVSNIGPVGSLADITTTSFYPTKPLGCYGDGGAIFTQVEEYACRLRSLRNHGEGDTRYQYKEIGICSRLDTLQAAVLLAKLNIFSDELEQRNRISQIYHDQLQDHVFPPTVHETVRLTNWAQYTIQLCKKDTESLAALNKRRMRILDKLILKGIPARAYYTPPLHSHPPYSPYVSGPLQNTDNVSAAAISLPIHPYLSDSHIEYITKQLIQAIPSA